MTPKDGLINRIIELEWDMFDKVTNTGGRAACQDDEWAAFMSCDSASFRH